MADHLSRRLVIGVSGLILLVTLGVVLKHAGWSTAIGVAYKAKMLCWGVFVSGRDLREILADLEVDNLATLRHVRVSTDHAERAVTATMLGVVRRRVPMDFEERWAGARSQPVRGSFDLAAVVETVDRRRLDTVLDRAFVEPNPLHQRRTRAVVIVHKGRIVAERYASGIGPDTPLIGWSMTKGVMNALVGILIHNGRLSKDAPVPIPEWQRPGDPRGRITLDQLLRTSSGLQFDENMTDPLADVIQMWLSTADVAAYATNKTLEAVPGTKWQYSSGSSNMIARIIRNILHDNYEYLTFPRRALYDRIGMRGAMLEADTTGTFVGLSFMYATARNWARSGLLYLHDEERILAFFQLFGGWRSRYPGACSDFISICRCGASVTAPHTY